MIDLKVVRQVAEIVDDETAEGLHAVIDDGAHPAVRAELVGQSAGDGGAAVAVAGPGLQLGARARPPDDAGVVDEPVNIVGQDARPGRIGDRTAVGADDRRAGRVAGDVELAGLDPLIADAGGDGEGRAQGHDDVAADEHAFRLGVEAAFGVGARPAGGDVPADRQPSRPHADAGGGAVGDGAVEIVAALGDRAVVVDLDIAEPVIGVDRDRPDMGAERRPGIGAVDLDRGVAVGDSERPPLAAGAGGHRARVELHAGDDLGVHHGDARMHVGVADVAAPLDVALVAIADRDVDPAGVDLRVDARGDAGVGQDVAAIEVGADDLGDLEIGMDRAAQPARPGAALGLRLRG